MQALKNHQDLDDKELLLLINLQKNQQQSLCYAHNIAQYTQLDVHHGITAKDKK